MIAEDSNVYERVAIEQWLKHQITSPATNNIIGKNLLPTVQIKNLLHSRITNSAKMSCKADAFTKECSTSPTHRKVLHHHCAYLIFNLFTPLTLWRMMIYVCASNCEPVCIYLCVCVCLYVCVWTLASSRVDRQWIIIHWQSCIFIRYVLSHMRVMMQIRNVSINPGQMLHYRAISSRISVHAALNTIA